MIHKIVPSTIWALLISELALVLTAYVVATYALLDVDPVLWLLYEGGLFRVVVQRTSQMVEVASTVLDSPGRLLTVENSAQPVP